MTPELASEITEQVVIKLMAANVEIDPDIWRKRVAQELSRVSTYNIPDEIVTKAALDATQMVIDEWRRP